MASHAAAVPLLLFLATLAFRAVALTPSVIDWDESLYLLQAREWLRGGWPLVSVWDMHPVGAPAIFALATGFLGMAVPVVRLLGDACVAATAWALFTMVREAGGPRPVGWAAGLCYAALSVASGGLSTNTELLFAPLVATSLLLGLRGARDAAAGPRWGRLAIMGGLIGVGLTIKPVVTPEGCLAFALLTLPAWRRGLLPTGRALAMAAGYAVFCATPCLLLALAYWLHGGLVQWIDGSFLAPFRYAQGRLPFDEAWPRIAEALGIFAWTSGLALLALVAGLWRRDHTGGLTRFALLWLAVAGVAVAGPGLYYNHYFLIALPPLSLLAAVGGWRLAQWAPRRWAMPVQGLALVVAALPAWYDGVAPLLRHPFRWHDASRQVASFIGRELRPGEPIFVANYQPVVYVLSGAAVPTRFAFPGHLTGSYARVSDIDTDAEVARILRSRPRFIIVDRTGWNAMRPGAASLIGTALADGYERATTVNDDAILIEVWRRR